MEAKSLPASRKVSIAQNNGKQQRSRSQPASIITSRRSSNDVKTRPSSTSRQKSRRQSSAKNDKKQQHIAEETATSKRKIPSSLAKKQDAFLHDKIRDPFADTAEVTVPCRNCSNVVPPTFRPDDKSATSIPASL